jgi:hypothetical protein
VSPFHSFRTLFPNSKTEVTEKELKDLNELLKRKDLSDEERDFFFKKKASLKKEMGIDWDEEKLKKMVVDFPYERDHYYRRTRTLERDDEK